MHDKINKAYSMLGIIKRNFKYLTIPTFILLYKNMVRSYLDYCSSVWIYTRSMLYGHHTESVTLRTWRRYRKGQPDYCPNSKAGITLTD